jgi:signal transduction histidine kinase
MEHTEQDNGFLRRLNVVLGRMGPMGATAALTAAAVIAALGTLLLIDALGGPPLSWAVAATAVTVTIVVALPIILYSQYMIRKLRASRRALKDVTTRLAVAVDDAEQASRAKSTFLANMSHELRTPLNAIIGFSEMIRDQHIGPVGNHRYLSYADDIHVSGRHLLNIINDILDLSKIEAGKMSIAAAAEFELAGAVADSLRIVHPTAEQAEVSLIADLPNLAVRLVAVERMVQQILINLVANAVKFTPPGGSVRLTGAPAPDGSYVLTISDTGVGMTREEVARALVPFGQIESAMSGKHAGTGLGLPLAKAMIELHDGSLRIQSVPQEGTRVSLTFPPQRVVPRDDAVPRRAAR